MYSVNSNCPLRQLGFPIRKSPDQSLLTAPRGGIVVRHVLLRLLVPRHPPCALISLTSAPVVSVDPALKLFSLIRNLCRGGKKVFKMPESTRNNLRFTFSKEKTCIYKRKDHLDVSAILFFRYPVFKVQFVPCFSKRKRLVEPSGIEPLTSCLQGRRSPS
jgi:hypothetical protein